MDKLEIEDLDDQRLYYDYIKEHYSLGSNRRFEKVAGGQNFPSPICKQEIRKERSTLPTAAELANIKVEFAQQ